MGVEYKEAPEIAEIATALIKDHHSHLTEAVIEYLWREGAWTSKGKIVLGSATLVTGLEKYYLDGANFRILINADAWATLDPVQRRAVVDHQLFHCEKDGDGERDGAPKWVIAPHDIEEFGGVLDRHGLYLNDIRQFVEVAMKKSEHFQARLDLGAAEAAATTETGGEQWEYEGPDRGKKEQGEEGTDGGAQPVVQ